MAESASRLGPSNASNKAVLEKMPLYRQLFHKIYVSGFKQALERASNAQTAQKVADKLTEN